MLRCFCGLSRTALPACQGAVLLEQGKDYLVGIWEDLVTEDAPAKTK